MAANRLELLGVSFDCHKFLSVLALLPLPMAGLGTLVFILPVIVGIAGAVCLLSFSSLRPFAKYAVLVPLLGASGAWVGLDFGIRWAGPDLNAYFNGLSQNRFSADFRIATAFLGGGVIGIVLAIILMRFLSK